MIKLYKINPAAINPTRHGAMWDVAIPETITIQPGELKIVGLGFSAEIVSEGVRCGAKIYARSSTFKTWGVMLANGVGVIDPDYCGANDEWKLALYSPNSSVTIPGGTRLAQFDVFSPSRELDIVIVDQVNCKDRGGFGSTGK